MIAMPSSTNSSPGALTRARSPMRSAWTQVGDSSGASIIRRSTRPAKARSPMVTGLLAATRASIYRARACSSAEGSGRRFSAISVMAAPSGTSLENGISFQAQKAAAAIRAATRSVCW